MIKKKRKIGELEKKKFTMAERAHINISTEDFGLYPEGGWDKGGLFEP